MVEIRRLDPNGQDSINKLFSRIFKFARDIQGAENPEAFTRSVVARAMSLDPEILVLGAYDERRLVGHGVAEILSYVDGRCAFVHQTCVDGGYPGVVQTLIDYADGWAKRLDCSIMKTVTVARLHSEQVWKRAYKHYGFKVVGYVMERAVQ